MSKNLAFEDPSSEKLYDLTDINAGTIASDYEVLHPIYSEYYILSSVMARITSSFSY